MVPELPQHWIIQFLVLSSFRTYDIPLHLSLSFLLHLLVIPSAYVLPPLVAYRFLAFPSPNTCNYRLSFLCQASVRPHQVPVCCSVQVSSRLHVFSWSRCRLVWFLSGREKDEKILFWDLTRARYPFGRHKSVDFKKRLHKEYYLMFSINIDVVLV